MKKTKFKPCIRHYDSEEEYLEDIKQPENYKKKPIQFPNRESLLDHLHKIDKQLEARRNRFQKVTFGFASILARELFNNTLPSENTTEWLINYIKSPKTSNEEKNIIMDYFGWKYKNIFRLKSDDIIKEEPMTTWEKFTTLRRKVTPFEYLIRKVFSCEIEEFMKKTLIPRVKADYYFLKQKLSVSEITIPENRKKLYWYYILSATRETIKSYDILNNFLSYFLDAFQKKCLKIHNLERNLLRKNIEQAYKTVSIDSVEMKSDDQDKEIRYRDILREPKEDIIDQIERELMIDEIKKTASKVLQGKKKQAFELRFYKEKSYPEIAKKMNVTSGTVRWLVSESVKTVRENLPYK